MHVRRDLELPFPPLGPDQLPSLAITVRDSRRSLVPSILLVAWLFFDDRLQVTDVDLDVLGGRGELAVSENLRNVGDIGASLGKMSRARMADRVGSRRERPGAAPCLSWGEFQEALELRLIRLQLERAHQKRNTLRRLFRLDVRVAKAV